MAGEMESMSVYVKKSLRKNQLPSKFITAFHLIIVGTNFRDNKIVFERKYNILNYRQI